MVGFARLTDAYDDFLSRMKLRPRGTGTINAIDHAPPSLAALAAYFAALSPSRLASCWVACITDSVDPDLAGDMARACVVVAERLHGVKFDEPIAAPSPLRVIGKEAQMADKATPLVDSNESFSICNGAPPLPARMGRVNPLADAINRLQPGQYIVVRKDKVKKSTVVATANRLRNDPDTPMKGVRTYMIANGDMVVINDRPPTKAATNAA